MTTHEAEVADDVYDARYLGSDPVKAHGLIESEAERTAEHWKATCSYVAFYGLFYVRREGWPKRLRWNVWERARHLAESK